MSCCLRYPTTQGGGGGGDNHLCSGKLRQQVERDRCTQRYAGTDREIKKDTNGHIKLRRGKIKKKKKKIKEERKGEAKGVRIVYQIKHLERERKREKDRERERDRD